MLTPAGIRKDFQQALAELRTDLDVFTPEESNALMACGYQMTRWAFAEHLQSNKELSDPERPGQWVFASMLEDITSTGPDTTARKTLLGKFRAGSKSQI